METAQHWVGSDNHRRCAQCRPAVPPLCLLSLFAAQASVVRADAASHDDRKRRISEVDRAVQALNRRVSARPTSRPSARHARAFEKQEAVAVVRRRLRVR